MSRVAIQHPAHETASAPAPLTACCIVVPSNSNRDGTETLAALGQQSEPPNRIIVIDILAQQPTGAYSSGQRALNVRSIAAPDGNLVNGLNRALAEINEQLVVFLRAGDIWSPDYLAQLRRVYAEHPEQDFIFCDSQHQPIANCPDDREFIDLGHSAVASYLDLDYVGGPLSCLSMRRAMALQILPLPDDVDWRSHPEAGLVLGASLAGARKGHWRRSLVTLADAADDACWQHATRLADDFAYRLQTVRLVGKLKRKLHVDADALLIHTGMEYHTQAENDWPTFLKYRRFVELHVTDDASRRRMQSGLYRRVKQHLRSQRTVSSFLTRQWLKWTLGRGGAVVR